MPAEHDPVPGSAAGKHCFGDGSDGRSTLAQRGVAHMGFKAVNEVADAKAARKRRQAFYTPTELVQKLVQWADVSEFTTCLEPSAGDGRIVHALREAGVQRVDACEIEAGMHGRIKEAGGNVVGTDFLKYRPAELYDRIVMNPPFKGKTWQGHVEHAWGMLATGGVLLSLAPGDADRIVRDHGLSLPGCTHATTEQLDGGLFKEFETGIRVTVIEARREKDSVVEEFSNAATANAALTIENDLDLVTAWRAAAAKDASALAAMDEYDRRFAPEWWANSRNALVAKVRREIGETGGSCYGVDWGEVAEYLAERTEK